MVQVTSQLGTLLYNELSKDQRLNLEKTLADPKAVDFDYKVKNEADNANFKFWMFEMEKLPRYLARQTRYN